MNTRCYWCADNELLIKYHDLEWGTPVHDDKILFEFILLEGAQAGLSWLTILKKREDYRKAFDNFDFYKIAKYDEGDFERLINNPKIVRNKLKIKSAITNAQATIEIIEEFGSLDSYLWSYVDGSPIINRFKTLDELPIQTDISDKLSKDLKKRGFKFVGSTIMYSFMQAVGMVNDHTIDCFRYNELINSES
ncbi:MAG: DNA-3-methyladenine glycosylase I [Pleomorphochaeta sp.]